MGTLLLFTERPRNSVNDAKVFFSRGQSISHLYNSRFSLPHGELWPFHNILTCSALSFILLFSYETLDVLRYSKGMFDLPSLSLLFSLSTQSFLESYVSTHYYLVCIFSLTIQVFSFFFQFCSIFSHSVPLLLHFSL